MTLYWTKGAILNPNYNPITAARIVEEITESINTYLSAIGDPVLDKLGHRTSLMSGSFRFVAVGQFVVHNDREGFRTNMKESVALILSLFGRADERKNIAGSYLTMLNYQHVFDAFAACEFELGAELARCMGGRQEIERDVDHPFDTRFGYTLKAVLSDDDVGIQKWLPEFKKACSGNMAGFLPYAEILQAIVDHDAGVANERFDGLIEGHKRLCKGKGVFALDIDNELCVRGIGLANLCRWRGIPVEARPPLIPDALLYQGE